MAFFQAALLGAPRVSDAGAAALGMARLRERAEATDDGAWARQLADDPAARPLLEGIFANSPFLTACVLADVPFLRRVLGEGPDAALGWIGDDLKDRVSRELDEERLRAELRVAKRRAALAVALADLAGHWLLDRVTQALSDFADVALSAAISHLLLREAEKGELVLADPDFPEDGCGYVALAMGKHGARELNYSSDIDLIILHDTSKVEYRGRRTPEEAFIRLTQRLISILSTRGADGYVFRVDLNLRPDPRSTPVAVSLAFARTYYATRGQTWERAAMIKARSAAGDRLLGDRFLAELEPFVWRDHLDFWALRDIRAIKRRLHAERGGGEVAFFGHNVKLGRGGIREIELFAQTQQLVLGGRDPYLRCRRTVEALTTLAESGAIDEEVTDELTEAYEVLRLVEHRLQMVDDQQTQTLPDGDAAMGCIAAFMGCDDVAAFRDTLLHHLRGVEARYAALFEDEAEPAPATVALALPAGADARARELLDELTPAFVEAAASRPDPDEALALLRAWLLALAEPVRPLALLAAQRELVALVMDVVSTAPALAAALAAAPGWLEAAVAPSFFAPPPERKVLAAECAEALRAGGLDDLARWAGEHRFQIATHVLRQTLPADAAGRAFSDVADVVVERLWRRAGGAGPPPVVVPRPLTFGGALEVRFEPESPALIAELSALYPLAAAASPAALDEAAQLRGVAGEGAATAALRRLLAGISSGGAPPAPADR